MTAPLNFAAQVVHSIRGFIGAEYWPDNETMDSLAQLIERAQHFQLPDGGRIFDDGLRGIRGSVIRLPFPEVTVEYRVPVEMHRLTEKSPNVCTKRLALALYQPRRALDHFISKIPAAEQFAFDEGAIQIVVANWLDQLGLWIPLPVGWVMASAWDVFSTGTVDRPKIVGYPHVILNKRMALLEKDGIKREDLVLDIWDEVCAVLDFIEASNCSNVTNQSIQKHDPKLNARRARDKKLPLYEVKVLTVDVLSKSGRGEGLGGHHASPRMHLRRGHVRRLKDRTVWVNSAVVGDPKRGFVDKSYQLRR